MTIPTTTHTSSHNLIHHTSAMANCRSTKANNEDNGGIPETLLHCRNDHQGIQHNVEEVTTHDKPLRSQIDTNKGEVKASHMANDSRHRVFSKRIASYMARQATVPLIVPNAADFKLCQHSRSNPLRLTTLSRETKCWATYHWL